MLSPSQILRGKRAASQDAAGAKRRARSLGGRRVSFAPDDELETMHLFTVRRGCVWYHLRVVPKGCCLERRMRSTVKVPQPARAQGIIRS